MTYTLRKIKLLSEVIFACGFLYFLHAYLQSFLHQQHAVAAQQWLTDPLLLLQEHALFAVIFLPGAWLFFYHILPRANALPQPKLRLLSCDKINYHRRLLRALLMGLAAALGLLCFIVVFHYWLAPNLPDTLRVSDRPRLTPVLTANMPLLLWRLSFSAVVTGIVEEIFYRHSVQNYLSSCFAPSGAIIITAVIFALAHPLVWFAMLVPALTFGFLYWKQGLIAAIMAHICYNAGILLLSASTMLNGYSQN